MRPGQVNIAAARIDDRIVASRDGGNAAQHERKNSGVDTIFAVASGVGRAAIAVVRISGPATGDVVAGLVASPLPEPRRASLRQLRHPRTRERLDQALVLWLPAPASFTGEDQAELHLHGGLAVKAAVLSAIGELAGCRPAEPGEFIRRAFLNGRLDLTEVEGVADLIEAETEAQRRQALRQMEGGLASRAASWREVLLDGLARCEAVLDFADEDDVSDDVQAGVVAEVAQVRREIATALATADRGERIRDGYVVVIAGAPNTGKSTLLNAIARRDVAIVSPIPGTTRDAIEIRCDLRGYPVTFIDTAGLRQSDDAIELAGMARTRSYLSGADLVVWLTPVTGQPAGEAAPRGALRVGTKRDLLGEGAAVDGGFEAMVSGLTGAGIPDLLDLVGTRLAAGGVMQGDAIVTRERHRLALQDVVVALDRSALAGQGGAFELVAEDLRLALRALGRLAGEVDVEDVLDRIFSTFCIGK